MPQTARGRKTSSTRSRKPAGSRSRSRDRASSRSHTGGAASSRKKKTTARGKAKKTTAAARAKKKQTAATRGKAVRSARQTTSRPRRNTATTKKSAARKKPARRTTRKTSPARGKAASRGAAAAARRSAAASVASRNGRTRDGGARAKDALLARRAETLDLLERSADYGKQRLREDAEDLVDQATDSQARDVVYALSSAEGDMIKEIDGALERIDAGEYGTCVNCGEPIQKRRLEAVPWARLCVACQELQEQGILQPE